jgi:MOSC domain-containing protein YiiM
MYPYLGGGKGTKGVLRWWNSSSSLRSASPIKPPARTIRDHGRVSPAHIVAVNVVHEIRPGYFQDTAIDKRPVRGPVEVDHLGLTQDQQISRGHGGIDKAVYAYAAEDAAWWARELGRDIPPGLFGENLRTTGLDVTGAQIGERWSIGDVLLQVQMPRTPCENLSLRMGIDGFHQRFNSTGRVGALLKVLSPGTITAGDQITVEQRPDHGVTVSDLATGPDAEQMQSLLDSGVPLARNVKGKARRVVRRAAVDPF